MPANLPEPSTRYFFLEESGTSTITWNTIWKSGTFGVRYTQIYVNVQHVAAVVSNQTLFGPLGFSLKVISSWDLKRVLSRLSERWCRREGGIIELYPPGPMSPGYSDVLNGTKVWFLFTYCLNCMYRRSFQSNIHCWPFDRSVTPWSMSEMLEIF